MSRFIDELQNLKLNDTSLVVGNPKGGCMVFRQSIAVLLLTVLSVYAKNEPHILPVGAIEALSLLKKGNDRFISGIVRTDGQAKEDIARLFEWQGPNAIVLSCSDSRVSPEIVFDQKLGEIFTVRSAGAVLSPSLVASIEYAVETLGSRLVVVLGHTNCGAVQCAMDTLGGKSAGSANLNLLVADIHPRIRGKVKQPSKNLETESWLNARGAAQDLVKRSDLIARAVTLGKIKIVSGLYSFTTGAVVFD